MNKIEKLISSGYRKYGNTNYYMNIEGNVIKAIHKNVFKPFSFSCGIYYQNTIRVNKKSRAVYKHRMLAELFIPNPSKLEQVNHIDGNKHNNCIKNLEWCSKSYNQKHAYRLGLKVNPNKKPVLCLLTGIFYDSLFEISIAKCVSKDVIQYHVRKDPNKFNICLI